MTDSETSSSDTVPLQRRFPPSFGGLDLTFCRNPACDSFGVHPDLFKRPNGAPPVRLDALRGHVKGTKHEEFFQCPTCNKASPIKNNRR